MFTKKNFKISILIIFTLLITSACSLTFKTSKIDIIKEDGGVFKSTNFGDNWLQESSIATISRTPANFSASDITALIVDPNDNLAIYAGVGTGGLVYSYDSARSWQVATTLGKRPITDILISPQNKCIIYVASENRIFKSDDCSRTWLQIYFDNNQETLITSLASDPKNNSLIYAGTSRGELIQSSDSGNAWTTRFRFYSIRQRGAIPVRNRSNWVTKVLVNQRNANNIWVATKSNAVYQSMDRGVNWVNYQEQFVDINGNAVFINDLAIANSDGKTVIAATNAGLIRSINLGANWHNVDVIPPSANTVINHVAMSFDDINTIYYLTDTSFGVSKDGGVNWESKKLPTTRTGSALAVDFKNPGVVYIGAFFVEPEKFK